MIIERLIANLCICRCPCLTCSIKISQVGISEVVYSQSYSMDQDVRISSYGKISELIICPRLLQSLWKLG